MLTFAHKHMYVHTQVSIYTHPQIHTYVHIHKCLRTYVHTHTYTNAHIRIRTHAYTRTYVHMHTHTYVHMHTHSPVGMYALNCLWDTSIPIANTTGDGTHKARWQQIQQCLHENIHRSLNAHWSMAFNTHIAIGPKWLEHHTIPLPTKPQTLVRFSAPHCTPHTAVVAWL